MGSWARLVPLLQRFVDRSHALGIHHLATVERERDKEVGTSHVCVDLHFSAIGQAVESADAVAHRLATHALSTWISSLLSTLLVLLPNFSCMNSVTRSFSIPLALTEWEICIRSYWSVAD